MYITALVDDNGQPIPLMDIAEFRALGFLQEANRRFFHPLGLSLHTAINPRTGEEVLAGIGDRRDHPEGIFCPGEAVRDGFEDIQRKADMVSDWRASKALERMNRLGICIDPRGIDPDEEVPMLEYSGIQPINWYPLPAPPPEEVIPDAKQNDMDRCL